MLLKAVIMALRSVSIEAGEVIIECGAVAQEMYLLCQGEVEVVDAAGKVLAQLKTGDFFGEVGLLASVPRTGTVRAVGRCDLFVLEQHEFFRILRDYPHFAEAMSAVARERYQIAIPARQLMAGSNDHA